MWHACPANADGSQILHCFNLAIWGDGDAELLTWLGSLPGTQVSNDMLDILQGDRQAQQLLPRACFAPQ